MIRSHCLQNHPAELRFLIIMIKGLTVPKNQIMKINGGVWVKLQAVFILALDRGKSFHTLATSLTGRWLPIKTGRRLDRPQRWSGCNSEQKNPCAYFGTEPQVSSP
jgi:hypothetical protein